MVTVANDKWIADLNGMACWNFVEGITVVFEREGKALVGKIKNMPVGLLDIWAGEPDGEKKVLNIIFEAEDVFLRAYFESKIEGQRGA